MKFQDLIVEPTLKTPHIDLNQLTGDLIFSGKSIPENAAKVYAPVLIWVTKYILSARPATNLRIDLEYFNTSSLLWLTKIFKILMQISEPDYSLMVHLYLPVDEYDEMSDFEDILDTFSPIEDLAHCTISSVGIKVHGINNKGEMIKETLVFI
jgi:hypothetical protein